jgi:di/tricarboxylate transporter
LIEPIWQMWAVFALIAVAIVFYASELASMELISFSFIAAALLLFHFAPIEGADGSAIIDARKLLSGFAEPALVAVLCLLIIGQGLIRTGALEGPIQSLTNAGINHPGLILAFVFLLVSILSAFVNNTPIVIIFIPLLTAMAERYRRNGSTLMMPLSFAAILGGMTTIIGSSTNLLVAGSFEAITGKTLGFFDFTIPGLLLAAVGLVYVIFVMPRFFNTREAGENQSSDGRGRQYIAQWNIPRNGRLVGEGAVAGLFPTLRGITVRMIERDGQVELPPFDDFTFQQGDTVVVAATKAELMNLLSVAPAMERRRERGQEIDPVLVEVVVPPASRMVGRNLQQIGFEHQTHCFVLGLQRRSRMVRTSMDDIRLEAGDVLLIYGDRQDVSALRSSRDVVLLEWSSHDVPTVWHARRARLIFAGVVLAALSGLTPIVVASVLGVVAMVASGCLNIHQAARAVDRRIALLIAAALAMGISLGATGGADYLAHKMISLFSDFGPGITLAAMFMIVAIMTNVISNNATAVLFTPIALSAAAELGVDARAFLFAVIFAANCSFATPMGYQTNLLVMGPGHYQFADFLKAGVPLVILIWLTYSFFAPWYFGF